MSDQERVFATPRRGPNGERVVPCRSCGAPMYWLVTPAGKRMPVSVDTGESHFKDCPDAARWSRKTP